MPLPLTAVRARNATPRDPTVLGRVPLVDADPGLGECLADRFRHPARHALSVRVLLWERGIASIPPALMSEGRRLMVLDGFLVRHLQVGPVAAAEVLGSGDVFEAEQGETLEALECVRLACLDSDLTHALPRWPQIAAALSERGLARSRRLSLMLCLTHLKRTDERVLASLWYLAGHWGRVGSDGILVPFRLTHEQLARIVVARRPSVTTALGALAARGLVTRRSSGCFVVNGDPPHWLSAYMPVLAELTGRSVA